MKPDDLRAARLKLGRLTQTEAGLLFGTPLRTWQDWEGGARKPHGSTLLLIRLATERPDVVEWLTQQGETK
jgi:DNA-binding transcriptional regulator YiaG